MPDTGAAGVVEGLKQSVTAPQKAATQHFWVFLAVFLFLAMVAFVILERKKAGIITRMVHGSVGRVPGVRSLVTCFALFVGLAALMYAGGPSSGQIGQDDQGTPAPLFLFMFGVVRKNHFSRKWMPLNSGASGSTVLVPNSIAPVKVPWEIDKLPTRDHGLHWYLSCLWQKLEFDIVASEETADDVYSDGLDQVLHSYELRNKGKLGTMFAQGDTNGSRLGLIDARLAAAYHPQVQPQRPFIHTDDSSHRVKMIPLTFTQGCFDKPHHFAPHCALMNGALLDAYVNTAPFGPHVALSNVKISLMAEMLGMHECHLHTPVKAGRYEPTAQGLNPRLKLLGLGSKGGLNGVMDGMGLAAMYIMTGAAGAGLGGVVTLDRLKRVQADFLGIESLEFPELLMQEFLQSIGNHVEPALSGAGYHLKFPYLESGSPAAELGNVLRANALLYPLVMPPLVSELSKVRRVDGTGEIKLEFDYDFGTVAYQVGTMEVGEWDPAFMVEAKKIIFGNEADQYAWVQKLTKKQQPTEEGEYNVDEKKMKYFPWKALRTKAKAA